MVRKIKNKAPVRKKFFLPEVFSSNLVISGLV